MLCNPNETVNVSIFKVFISPTHGTHPVGRNDIWFLTNDCIETVFDIFFSTSTIASQGNTLSTDPLR